MSRCLRPPKWRFISAVNSSWRRELHDGQCMRHLRVKHKQPGNICLFKIEHSEASGILAVESEDWDMAWRKGGLDLLVQDNTEQGATHSQATVIVDQAKLSEFIHEEIHS